MSSQPNSALVAIPAPPSTEAWWDTLTRRTQEVYADMYAALALLGLAPNVMRNRRYRKTPKFIKRRTTGFNEMQPLVWNYYADQYDFEAAGTVVVHLYPNYPTHKYQVEVRTYPRGEPRTTRSVRCASLEEVITAVIEGQDTVHKVKET